MNVIAPGIGTIISAFLATQLEPDTLVVGFIQLVTVPLLGLGFIWAMIWSVRLYRSAEVPSTAEYAPLATATPIPHGDEPEKP